MPIHVNNPEADALTRKFARLAGLNITEAIITAMKEAIERREGIETPLETAARLRRMYGVVLSRDARKALSRDDIDAMWEEG